MHRLARGLGHCQACLGSTGGAEPLVLKPYLGEQNADRHIRSCDCPDQRAGASMVSIQQPAFPPVFWSVRPRVTSAGPFSANESLGPKK